MFKARCIKRAFIYLILNGKEFSYICIFYRNNIVAKNQKQYKKQKKQKQQNKTIVIILMNTEFLMFKMKREGLISICKQNMSQ